MTPEEARRLIKAHGGSTHGPGTDCPTCKAVKRNAWEMTQQIAGMTYEYAVQVREEHGQWHQVTEWNPNPNPYKPGHAPKHNERLVRRLVSQPEEVQP